MTPKKSCRPRQCNGGAIRPGLIAYLNEYLAGTGQSTEAAGILFLGLHLAAARNDTAIFRPLCRLLHDGDAGLDILGDAITETLPSILIGVFDGDTSQLTSVVDDKTLDDFVRGAALLAMAYLTHIDRLPEASMREFLRLLPERLDAELEEALLSQWARAIGYLGYEDFAPQVEAALGRMDMEYASIDVAEFRDILQDTLADPTGMAGFDAELIRPLTDPIGLLSTWASFSGEDDGDESDAFGENDVGSTWESGAEMPYINPLRHVGRNDPCPCGSGKKYKKCCLV